MSVCGNSNWKSQNYYAYVTTCRLERAVVLSVYDRIWRQKPEVTTLARHEHGNLSHKRRRRSTEVKSHKDVWHAYNLSVESNQNVKLKQKSFESKILANSSLFRVISTHCDTGWYSSDDWVESQNCLNYTMVWHDSVMSSLCYYMTERTTVKYTVFDRHNLPR